MKTEKCGIYKIECVPTGVVYVGSSKQIYTRWSQHRRSLRGGGHTSVYLQNAWNKHGEECFKFSIIEECSREALIEREQYYIDLLQPKFNTITKLSPKWMVPSEVREKLAAALRARAAKITHCPHGHAYDEANTGMNNGKRFCRECNRLRALKNLANETPEQREKRQNQQKKRYFDKRDPSIANRGSPEHIQKIVEANTGRVVSEEARKKIALAAKAALTPERLEKMIAAAQERIKKFGPPRLGQSPSQETREKISKTLLDSRTHCAQGHPFDEANTYIDKKLGKRVCRACRKRIKAEARANETPEQKAVRLEQKRRSWHRCKQPRN